MKLNHLIFVFFMAFFSLSANACDSSNPTITFVCTGNTGRSPMAEALARDFIHKKHLSLFVQSRGVSVNPKETSPEKGTVQVLSERDISVSSHKATQFSQVDVTKSDLILTMSEKHKNIILKKYPEAKGKVFTLSEYATGKNKNLADPYGKPLKAYRITEHQLDALLPKALTKFSIAGENS